MLSRGQRGVTLIELMIGLAILSILLFLAVPNFSIFLQNTQIRNAGESVLQGLNLARAEALRRNSSVRFQFVTNLTSGCALSDAALSWVVSIADPAGKCHENPGTTATGIVQKQSSRDGTPNVLLDADATSVVFNGMGRVVGAGIGTIDLRSLAGACEHEDANGTMRCLRVLVSTGGQIRLCDPKVNPGSTDPRRCPAP
ncbi:MAG TPA: GspH/FimT family pseudopilin [Burkholderiales bacterium]|nr:GspH/FimT family pseudopilin [Burkholderiales bacterium]